MSEINKTKIPNEENLRLLVQLIKSLSDAEAELASQCINIYDPNEVYAKGRACFHENENGKLGLYVAKNATTGEWNANSWKEVDLTELQYLSKSDIDALFEDVAEETWNYLERILNDSEISVNKSWSSSKVYTELLDILKQSKDYTLVKIAESATPSFKIITAESQVTEDSVIYLYPKDDGTCGIYILKDGLPYLVQSSLIKLDDYLKIADAEKDYLKSADAELKYKDIESYENEVGNVTDLLSGDNIVEAINDIRYDLDNIVDDTIVSKNNVYSSDKVKSLVDEVNTNLNSIINFKGYNNTLIKVNLDEYYTVGSYIVLEDCDNLPYNNAGWFFMNVYGGGNGGVVQEIINNYNNEKLYRTFNGFYWTSWQKLVTMDKVEFKPSSGHIIKDTAYDTHTEYQNGNMFCCEITANNKTGADIDVGGTIDIGSFTGLNLSKMLIIPVASYTGSTGLFPAVSSDTGKITLRVIGAPWKSNYGCAFRIIMIEHT